MIEPQSIEGWNACTWIAYPGMDRAGTLRRATPRCFEYARRFYREAPPREGLHKSYKPFGTTVTFRPHFLPGGVLLFMRRIALYAAGGL